MYVFGTKKFRFIKMVLSSTHNKFLLRDVKINIFITHSIKLEALAKFKHTNYIQ